ncbi:FadR family transcriptional regulator [Rhizobium pusense]|jgi:GntR family transcriptional repressor for pyruvate dehydrogenase complex|uniref:Transcriptional regulator n=2 Tax=Hyphomicrobiales TaxID=356 RepID=A0A1L9CKY6_9HYPH|nr:MULTISPECIES: FadR/GntR family transcriptional regulator [Rhizobium/Agrobacterium group]AMD57166.1 GntR family transcriptional regulator [Agrobacterium tumefaciens]ANV25836.1 GntR family transcriptional regulator [Rhizobium sp. S41]AUC12817.1 GntR family transcriptional regulator [Rhizobium sp. Y9]EKJ97364.1 GntR family transcriptional regulator [Bradyrhizobium lupini HPC(L)]KGE81266.1 GntR family transcriptional regulator [Rhizobium sp. H41]KIV67237.1 Transcriptional regulator, GntR famil
MIGDKARPRERRAQQIIDNLSAEIRSGKLKNGDQLPTEPQLERAYGVSRTVVREAIADLRSAGYVVPIQGKGVFVSSDSEWAGVKLTQSEVGTIAETLEMLEFRLATEGEAAAIAAYRRTAQQEAAISAAHRKMARAIDAGESTVDADYEFHSAIATATNNRFYLEALRQFGSRSIPRGQFPTLPETGDANYLRKVQAEHEAILRAIVEQDPDAARKAMREHMLASQRRYRLLSEAQ